MTAMKPDPAPGTTEEAQAAAAPEAAGSLLESLLAEPAQIALPSGRAVEARAERDGERVTVRAASGEVEVEILLTDRGPVLRLRAVDLQLAAEGAVSVDCGELRVRAERGIVQETGGEIALRGRAAKIESERGDVEIAANDDVVLRGERIKMNC
jgi:hypothetical protein